MSGKMVIITQNEALMREAMGQRIYFKRCVNPDCAIRITTRARSKRVCPRCGQRLVKTDERPEFEG